MGINTVDSDSIFNNDNQLPSITAGFAGASLESGEDRQPTNVNYLYQTLFKFEIFRLPKMEYFIQRVNLPGFGPQGNIEQPTRFVAAKHPNSKVSFENLTMTFLVNEDMSNWREIYDWMRSIYLTKDHKDYEKKISSHFTDGTLHILNSAMNPNLQIRFRNLLPVSLTGFEFDSSVTDITPFTAEITFAYDYYEFV
tara:strand:- start:5822 stop:6409 length:588 start_codon:yes stop_codon:yes gene_type:complete